MKTYLIAARSFLLLTGQLWAAGAFVPGEQLPLYYDVATGNVTIDTTNVSGGEFVSYALRHTSVGDDFIYENHTPFMTNLFSPNSTFNMIAETSWPGKPLTPGVYSLGNILPAGQTREEVSLSYFGETGFLSTPSNRTQFTYGAYGSFDLGQFHVFDIN